MRPSKEHIRQSPLQYKKSLGQHFLYDDDLLAQLVALAQVNGETDVLEIGPGAGTLTKHLCESAHHVLSLEMDERLIPLLGAYMEPYGNFSLVQGDAMAVDLSAVTAGLRRPFAVVANIPYYITTPLITRLLTSGLPLTRLCLMVQREVADKILSQPGDDGWGMLAVRCQYATVPEKLLDVPAACFTPPPKVDSAFIGLTVRETPAVQPASEADFFQVVNAAFALRRKTMVNALCACLRLERPEALSLMEAAALDERMRGEKLTLEELCRLSDAWTALQAAKEARL